MGAIAPIEGTPLPLMLVAAILLLDDQGRVLITSRPEGKSFAGLWEFAGGKIEAGETPEAALVREMREELGIDIAPQDLIPFTFISYTYPKNHLLMPLFWCKKWHGTVQPQEGQKMAWVEVTALANYPFVPADEPILPRIARDLPWIISEVT